MITQGFLKHGMCSARGILRDIAVTGPTEFGTVPAFLGRVERYGNDSTSGILFQYLAAMNTSDDVVSATADASLDGIGAKRLPPTLDAEIWEYVPAGDSTTRRIAPSPANNSGMLAVDAADNVYAAYRSGGTGSLDGADRTGVLSVDADGTLRWHKPSSGISNILGVSYGGDHVVAMCSSGNWADGAANERISTRLASDGSLVDVDTYTNAWGSASSPTHCTIFGADNDKILISATGGSGAFLNIVAKPVDNLGAAALWTLDKSVDFTSFGSVVRRVLRRPDGGLVILPGDTSQTIVYFVSEDGVVEEELDLSLELGTSGTSPSFQNMCYDIFGHLYVLHTASAGADIIRLDPALSVVWRASDYFTQAAATTVNTNTVELNDLMRCIAVSRNGNVCIGENYLAAAREGYQAIFTQGDA